tara:strand:- start:95 stop:883 length:789 start_codon:yes stop_codon:yes gene_type:complete
MHEFSADRLRNALQRLAHFVAIAEHGNIDQDWLELLPADMREVGQTAMQGTLEGVANLPVPITQIAISELIETFEVDGTTYDEIRKRTSEVNNTLRRELMTVRLYCVDPKHADLLKSTDPSTKPKPPFGVEVECNFPDAIDDIAEAGKCLALRRNTACVFHLMRAMETTVAALVQHTGATLTDQKGETLPWGILVANLKSKIEAMAKGKQQDDWLAAHSMLHSVNRAFRTKTAHPEKTYSDEQAENAFQAVKSFMQELATLI